jgi:histidinol-phosphatase
VEDKPDRSPVTQADRDANDAILAVLAEAFPDQDVLSEESGTHGPGTCDCRWIVDPLDGTRDFIRGDVSWGPMVAFEYQGTLLAAGMSMPVTGQTWWATKGGGCYLGDERVRVSTTTRWEDARLTIGYLRGLLAEPYGVAVLELLQSADQVRCPGNLAGCARVLDGTADAWLEAGVHEWDLAAPRLLLEEAGGKFTDFLGRPSHTMGMALGTNRVLHAQALAVLRAR